MGNDPNKPDFSNVKSGVTSTAPEAAPQPDFSNVQSGVTSTAEVIPDASEQTYTVAKGDTLSKIAKQFYGSANKWRAIYEANTDQLSNPDLIKIGQVLKIPAAKS
jgi:nucleoid-associated protein YgaU